MDPDVSPQRFVAHKTDPLLSRGGFHSNPRTKRHHYTIRGFKSDGFVYRTIHAFSRERSDVFSNGGKVWKRGRRCLDVNQDCEGLWYVINLSSYSPCNVSAKMTHV